VLDKLKVPMLDNYSLADPYFDCYVNVVLAGVKLHKALREVVSAELDRNGVHGLRPSWAIGLYRMGDRDWRAGELRHVFDSCETNSSYLMRKMASTGYLILRRSADDARVLIVSRAEQGRRVSEIVEDIFVRRSSHVTTRIAGREKNFADISRTLGILCDLTTDLKSELQAR